METLDIAAPRMALLLGLVLLPWLLVVVVTVGCVRGTCPHSIWCCWG